MALMQRVGSAEYGRLVRLRQGYERLAWDPLLNEFYGGSDYLNWGLWFDGCTDQRAACEALMDRVTAPVPAHASALVDVGCGKGAGLRYLSKRWALATITGVNISATQLARARENAPGCDLRLMDATRLLFPERSFDAVLCVEAAFHFRTRGDFFREAQRVLRPGGVLVLADIVTKPGVTGPGLEPLNDLPHPSAYGDLLIDAGFREAQVGNITERCVAPHFAAVVEFYRAMVDSGRLSQHDAARLMDVARQMEQATAGYVVAQARRE